MYDEFSNQENISQENLDRANPNQANLNQDNPNWENRIREDMTEDKVQPVPQPTPQPVPQPTPQPTPQPIPRPVQQVPPRQAAPMPPVPEQKKSGGSVFAKFLLAISLGLFFGIFAAIGFYGVKQAMGAFGIEQVTEQNPVQEEMIPEEFKEKEGKSEIPDKIVQVPEMDYNTVAVGSGNAVSSIVKEVMPAMVSIINNYTEVSSFWGQTYREELSSSGSGIIVSQNDEELLIVSNNHVVEGADKLTVIFNDESRAEAAIKGTDAKMDLAVIAVKLDDLSDETKAAIHVAMIGDSDELELGEQVIAIGNALGYGQSVTVGYISALNREMEMSEGDIRTFIQTDAAINPGNSGGALLNARGEVIGINSNKIGGSSVEGMGYAIPISSASPIIAELMERQTRRKVDQKEKGYMGISFEDVTDQISMLYGMPKGVYVVTVVEKSAAEAAGMRKGDVIIEFDGSSITCYKDLYNVLEYYAVGDEASVKVMRPINGEYKEVLLKIVLGERPAQN